KFYSLTTLQFRVAKYLALLAKYNYDIYGKLSSFIAKLPEEKQSQFQAIVDKGQLIAKTALEVSLDVMGTVARTTVMDVVMHWEAWLQSSGIPKALQNKVKDLPFNREKLFSNKTDEVLHSVKDSQATLRTLGIYTPPAKRR
ncbi:hypothetical protein UY3_04075, partial [Chelonia mydas]